MIILDTMVLSEPFRPRPNPTVIAWLDRQLPGELFVTAISQAEMEYGVWAMAEGRRRAKLHRGITELFEVDFSGRVLSFDTRAARMFGASIASARQTHGREAVGDLDGMIAAIAIAHDRCPVATRDGRPFALMGIEAVDPWAAWP